LYLENTFKFILSITESGPAQFPVLAHVHLYLTITSIKLIDYLWIITGADYDYAVQRRRFASRESALLHF